MMTNGQTSSRSGPALLLLQGLGSRRELSLTLYFTIAYHFTDPGAEQGRSVQVEANQDSLRSALSRNEERNCEPSALCDSFNNGAALFVVDQKPEIPSGG